MTIKESTTHNPYEYRNTDLKSTPSITTLFITICCISAAFSSTFHQSRKTAALRRWKKEMNTSYPNKEVLLATRYFIRDVAAGNQERIETTLLPLVAYLNTTTAAEQKKMLKSIYTRNANKPLPEPVDFTGR